MESSRRGWRTAAVVAAGLGLALGQGQPQKRTLVINGQSGEADVIEINGRSYIELETLARIGHGTLAFQGNQIVLTLLAPAGEAAVATPEPATVPGMSDEFMKAAIQDLATLKQWQSVLAYGLQHGIPGDGSRLFVFRDRAAEGLRLAMVAASTEADQNALQLLSNHFNNVEAWTNELIAARKSMNTANYSMSPDALNENPEYQKISRCTQVLGAMLAGGKFEDEAACH